MYMLVPLFNTLPGLLTSDNFKSSASEKLSGENFRQKLKTPSSTDVPVLLVNQPITLFFLTFGSFKNIP